MKDPEIPGIIIAIAAIARPKNMISAVFQENSVMTRASGFSIFFTVMNIIIANVIRQQIIDDIGSGNFFVCVSFCAGCGSVFVVSVFIAFVVFFALSQWVYIIGTLPSMIPMKNQFVCIGKLLNKNVMILLNNNTPANSPIPNGRMNFHWDMIFFTFKEITSINLL